MFEDMKFMVYNKMVNNIIYDVLEKLFVPLPSKVKKLCEGAFLNAYRAFEPINIDSRNLLNDINKLSYVKVPIILKMNTDKLLNTLHKYNLEVFNYDNLIVQDKYKQILPELGKVIKTNGEIQNELINQFNNNDTRTTSERPNDLKKILFIISNIDSFKDEWRKTMYMIVDKYGLSDEDKVKILKEYNIALIKYINTMVQSVRIYLLLICKLNGIRIKSS